MWWYQSGQCTSALSRMSDTLEKEAWHSFSRHDTPRKNVRPNIWASSRFGLWKRRGIRSSWTGQMVMSLPPRTVSVAWHVSFLSCICWVIGGGGCKIEGGGHQGPSPLWKYVRARIENAGIENCRSSSWEQSDPSKPLSTQTNTENIVCCASQGFIRKS